MTPQRKRAVEITAKAYGWSFDSTAAAFVAGRGDIVSAVKGWECAIVAEGLLERYRDEHDENHTCCKDDPSQDCGICRNVRSFLSAEGE